jgi:hypothetical protein
MKWSNKCKHINVEKNLTGRFEKCKDCGFQRFLNETDEEGMLGNGGWKWGEWTLKGY